jgi:hypothetical protein
VAGEALIKVKASLLCSALPDSKVDWNVIYAAGKWAIKIIEEEGKKREERGEKKGEKKRRTEAELIFLVTFSSQKKLNLYVMVCVPSIT